MPVFRAGQIACSHPGGKHNMAYRDWGPQPSEDLVVCLHGLARNAADFDELAAALAAGGRRVICPDMPGRGASDFLSDPAGYGIPQYLADMAILLEELAPRRIDWIGTSMGGLMGMIAAAEGQFPIERLVINDIGPFVPQVALAFIADYVAEDPLFANLEEADRYLRSRCQSFGPLSAAAWRKVAQDSVRNVPGGYRLHYDPQIVVPFRTAAKADIDLWPIWGKVACATLILRGADSPILLAQTAKKMTAGRPDSDLVTIPGCGHAPWLKTDDQISVILDWLRQ
ncbi:MAG: alpha/beta hydrolase [Pseudomonadota bacterium]